jgi:hypothetical protein
MSKVEFTMKVKIIAESSMSLEEVTRGILEGESGANDKSCIRFHFEFPKELTNLFETRQIMQS